MAGSVSTDRRQGVNAGAAFKVPVNVATTANLPLLNGLLTVDGVALADGARVLVWQQTSNLDNGVYNARTGQWRRAIDFDGEFDLHRGSLIWVVAGSTYANTLFQLTTPDISPDHGPVPNTNAMNFAIVTIASSAGIFSIVQNFLTSLDNSIKIVNNSTNQTINITNALNLPTVPNPPEVGGAYYIATINPNIGIQPSGSFLTQIGGTSSAVVETPLTTFSAKLARMLVSTSSAGTPCGHRLTQTASNGPILSSGAGAGGFTWGVLFGTHPTTETTASAAKFIGMYDVNGVWSLTPTGDNFTNNAAFNTGAAFGMVSNSGDANWNFFHKGTGLASTITGLGIARSAGQLFSMLVRNIAGAATTTIQIVQINPTTGALTTVFNQAITLAVPTNLFLQFAYASIATAAVLHGIVFQRTFLHVPDGAFLLA